MIWTAKCRSNYQINGKTCNKLTPRGVLICDSCQSAITSVGSTLEKGNNVILLIVLFLALMGYLHYTAV